MVKKLLALALAGFMFLSFGTAYGAMNDADYHGKIADLNKGIKDVHHDYIQQKNEARKDALAQLEKLGHTQKDKAARKQIMDNCKKKVAALKEGYKTTREALLNREKALREARKKEMHPVKKGKDRRF